MKTPRLLTLIAATLLCAALPQSSPAADVVVDISSFAPRDATFVVRQIELNVAIKQYEKVLMELHEARLQYEFGTPETGLTDEQQKQGRDRAERKLIYLEKTAAELRDRIRKYVTEANEMARAIEKDKADAQAKQKAGQSQRKVQNPG